MLDLNGASVMAIDIESRSYQFNSQVSIHFKNTERAKFGKVVLSLVIVSGKQYSRLTPEDAARLTLN